MSHKKETKVFQNESVEEPPNLKGDYQNVALLFILYVLQGRRNFLIETFKVLFQQFSSRCANGDDKLYDSNASESWCFIF